MRNLAIMLLAIILLSMKSDGDRKILICGKWMLVAMKRHDAGVVAIDRSGSRETIFRADSTYEENDPGNSLKMTGKYYLNGDETKIAFALETLNGQAVPPFPNADKIFYNVILKLTPDSLIYGMESSVGKAGEPLSTYRHVHDDLYFVKE